ncbi:MAG TPA: type II toxin-antitoxin system RelE/ParE family toxin [Terracidiphilus sp.]|nr:type II toxin-antitoxin system RelE/ParE family toxin [Terracidiphilus sp.]
MRLRISETAMLAIVAQADYYCEAASPALAERWESAVDAAIRSLLQFPERGALCSFQHASLSGLRWIAVPDFPRHLIFFRVSTPDASVLIVHVIHGHRDLEAVLADQD